MIDFNLKEGEPTINDDVTCLIQQIDILFDTTQGELLGDITYGTDYEYLLYDLKLNEDTIKEQMMNDLLSLDLLGYTPHVDLYFMKGTERDICIVQVDLYKHAQKFTKIYKIS